MTLLHLLQLSQVPILEQLRLEEALLRSDQRNWCIINVGSPPAIVMGISSQPSEMIHYERFKQAPVPLIRRFSGGGTVFIDEQTYFVTFICQASSVSISPYPESIMRWTEQIYQQLLTPLPFTLKENDYVLGHQKFGGNAQSIIKNRWLHHSSLLWDYSPANMDYLLFPKKKPLYREQRPHPEFLCRLKDYWPHSASFKDYFTDQLKLKFQVQEVNKEDIQDKLALSHRKATTLIEWS